MPVPRRDRIEQQTVPSLRLWQLADWEPAYAVAGIRHLVEGMLLGCGSHSLMLTPQEGGPEKTACTPSLQREDRGNL